MTTPATGALLQAGMAGSVVITGVGARGQVGDVIARSFAMTGSRVAIVARTVQTATARASELRDDGLQVHPFGCDLTDPVETDALARDVTALLGPVDSLINAAGGFASGGPVGDADPAILFQQFTINVATAYNTTHSFLPALRKSRGAIVFMASAAALPGARVKHVSAYAMAKSAVVTLMRAVAQEERGTGVRANAVAPGAIRTPANLRTMPDDTRYVDPSDLASVVRYLCSPAAAGLTGQVLEMTP